MILLIEARHGTKPGEKKGSSAASLFASFLFPQPAPFTGFTIVGIESFAFISYLRPAGCALKQASYEERPYDSVQPPIIDLGLRAPPVLVLFQKLNTALHVEEDCVQAVMPATIVCIAPNRIAT